MEPCGGVLLVVQAPAPATKATFSAGVGGYDLELIPTADGAMTGSVHVPAPIENLSLRLFDADGAELN